MVGCVCILYFGTYQSQLILLYGTCFHVGGADDTAACVAIDKIMFNVGGGG
jgi:hypothetical protein